MRRLPANLHGLRLLLLPRRPQRAKRGLRANRPAAVITRCDSQQRCVSAAGPRKPSQATGCQRQRHSVMAERGPQKAGLLFTLRAVAAETADKSPPLMRVRVKLRPQEAVGWLR